ncbi:hypothetical protein Hanom_Chr09g00778271 [Helianthus anomalus]
MLNLSISFFAVSGLSGTKDVAQEYVLTGVGLLAGSAILLLTLIWGTCVIVGGRKFSSESGSSTSMIPYPKSTPKVIVFYWSARFLIPQSIYILVFLFPHDKRVVNGLAV